jgi:hypothetical protein
VAFLAACLVTLAVQAASDPAPGGILPLSGVARDISGQGLEGVEILILERGATRALATTHTDAEGRFRIAGLAPGIYNVAGLKRGYRTWLGQIDTLLTASLEMLLRVTPGPDLDPEPPEDLDWLLRVPRRSILRDIEDAVLPPPEVRDALLARTFRDLLDLQVDQMFLLGESLPGSDSTPLEGSETRMRIAGNLGSRGRIGLDGSHERLSASTPRGDATAADREAASLRFNFSYDTGPHDSLDVNAFYSTDDLQLARITDAVTPEVHQGHRAWGYNANWSRQIDPVSRVSVNMDYRDASIEMPLGGLDLREAHGGGPQPVKNRRLGAEGTYEGVPGNQRRHQVKVGFRAQHLELPSVAGPTAPLQPRLTGSGIEGWSLKLNAEDQWSATAPLTLVYGLGYKHAIAGGDTTLLVPRVGGVYSHDRFSLRVLMSYNAADTWGRPSVAPAETGGFEPRSSVGYDARLEVPVSRAVRLSGDFSYAPIEFEEIAYDGLVPSPGQRPLYVSDGNAGARRHSLGLVHENERTVTTLRVTDGRAEGTLAAVPSFAGSVQLLTHSRLSYRNGSFGVRVIPSGTHLALEYRQLDETPAHDTVRDAGFEEQSVELRLMQDLLQALRGSWRLLVAVRVADQEREAELGSPTELSLASTGHQFSAGVSVSF